MARDDGDDGESLCAAWTLRALALACFVAGSRFAAELSDVEASMCPRAPMLTAFWSLVQCLGGLFLACDVAGCAFCLRCLWIVPHISRHARLFCALLWAFGVYGLTNYMLQIKDRRCWGIASLFAMLALLLYSISWLLWVVLIDCGEYFFSDAEVVRGRGGASAAACCCEGWLELGEWPADREDSDDDGPVRAEVATAATGEGGKRVAAPPPTPGTSAAAGPPPTATGRSRSEGSARHRARGEIRVLRGGELLHVGRTHRAVRRWIRRNVQDQRDVMVEDRTGPSSVRWRGASSPRPTTIGRGGASGSGGGGREAGNGRAGDVEAGHGGAGSPDDGRRGAGSSRSRPRQVPPLNLASLSSLE